MEKSDLIERLKGILASTFSLSLKAQNYHWNVTGINFSQHHDFFGEYYTTVNEHADVIAEQIRQLGSFAPGSLKRFSELTIISDEINVPSPKFMFVRLSSDNMLFLNELREVRDMADELGHRGLVVTLEDHIQYHEKMQWMIDAHADE